MTLPTMSLSNGPVFMAKLDIKSAFRLLPVHPEDFELLGFKFAPRIKRINKQVLYSLDGLKKYKKMQIAPKKNIKTDNIVLHWDTILRLLVTLKEKYASATQVFSRLNSYSEEHQEYL